VIILVINCGSSSIKYQLYKMPSREVLAKGLVEKIGEETSKHIHSVSNSNHKFEHRVKNHKEGISLILSTLTDKKIGVIKNMDEIRAIGHRVVHRGDIYSDSVIIDKKVISCIRDFADLAPLHNPPNLIGIEEAMNILPNVPMVAVFDTAFHQTLPAEAFTYAIPYEFYTEYRIRRYGFHGTSHAYVTHRASELLDVALENLNLITCHLGNGCSITAIKKGKSIDTSMGLTPLEGLVMGTRCGDIDPAIIFYLLKKEKYGSFTEIDKLLNKESGLLGISGFSNDIRNLYEASSRENDQSRSKLALNIFCYRLRKYIGAYMAVLGKVEAIVFTGGIGENAYFIREKTCSDLGNLGLLIDRTKNLNTTGNKEGDVASVVIPTDEEGWIATETFNLCRNKN